MYAALATKQQQHPLFDYRVDISRKISEASFFSTTSRIVVEEVL